MQLHAEPQRTEPRRVSAFVDADLPGVTPVAAQRQRSREVMRRGRVVRVSRRSPRQVLRLAAPRAGVVLDFHERKQQVPGLLVKLRLPSGDRPDQTPRVVVLVGDDLPRLPPPQPAGRHPEVTSECDVTPQAVVVPEPPHEKGTVVVSRRLIRIIGWHRSSSCRSVSLSKIRDH